MPLEKIQMKTHYVMRISRRGDGAILFEHENSSAIECLEAAAQGKTALAGADLPGLILPQARLGGLSAPGADMKDCRFTGAKMSGAFLTKADLSGAAFDDVRGSSMNLAGAVLKGASLTGAILSGSDLSAADLTGANLTDAILTGARLDHAKLAGADLSGCDLSDASLVGIDWKDVDVAPANWKVVRTQLTTFLSAILPSEVAALLESIRKGKIVESGVRGTVADMRDFDLVVHPRTVQAVEQMLSGVTKGDTPATNPLAKLLAGWIEEWMAGPAAKAAHRDICPACGQLRPKQAA